MLQRFAILFLQIWLIIFTPNFNIAVSEVVYDKCLSNVGKDFFVLILDCGRYGDYVDLYITTPVENAVVNVNIKTPLASSIDVNKVVNYGSETVVRLPESVLIRGTTRSNEGILVQADDFIVLYAANNQKNSGDSFIIYPIELLGNQYVSVNQESKVSGYNTVVSLAAITDNTIVNITVPMGVSFDFEGNTYTHANTLSVSLNQYEVFQLSVLHPDNLAGTLLSSNQTIAAFSGNDLTLPTISTASSVDMIYEMLIPVKFWSTVHYIVTNPIYDSGDGEMVTVYSFYDPTVIKINLLGSETQQTLTGGAYHRFHLPFNQSGFVTSDNPVMVAQEQSSAPEFLAYSSDANLILTAPIDSWMNDYSVTTPGRVDGQTMIHGIVILAHNSSIDKITLDNAALSSTLSWISVIDTDIVYTSIQLSQGFHRLTCIDGSFRCWGYLFGFHDIEGYRTAVGRSLNEYQIDKGALLKAGKIDNKSMEKNAALGQPYTDPVMFKVSRSLLGCFTLCNLHLCHVIAYDNSTNHCYLYNYVARCDSFRAANQNYDIYFVN